jgi:polyisoprenoid-binding protein YceI
MHITPWVDRNRIFGLSFLAVAVVLLFSLRGHAASYRLDSKTKNRVEFQSKARLESFSGKAKAITADFEIDTTDLDATTGTVTVDLRSLDTGIELRNRHMRDNHLHTDSFPNAVFVIDSIRSRTATAEGAEVMAHGTMTIHGTSRPISAAGTVQSVSGAGMRIQTEFPLVITAYGIPRPEFLFLKLAEEVKIVVDLTIVPVAE